MTTRSRTDTLTAYAFLLPAFLLLGIFAIFPIMRLFWISVHRWNPLRDEMRFVGLANYRSVFFETDFWRTLLNTGYFTLATVPLSAALGLGLALLLSDSVRAVGIFRTIVFTPFVTSAVASGVIFIWLLDYDHGFINNMFGIMGLEKVRWLQSEFWAMPSVILMTVWKQAGYTMVLFLSGLQGIPGGYYEAAAIDGVPRGWKTFRHITWPLLRPTTFFVLVISVIFSFRSFEQMYAMTRGGPVGATATLVYYIFDKAFKYGNMGQAAAASVVLLGVVLFFTWLQFQVARKDA